MEPYIADEDRENCNRGEMSEPTQPSASHQTDLQTQNLKRFV